MHLGRALMFGVAVTSLPRDLRHLICGRGWGPCTHQASTWMLPMDNVAPVPEHERGEVRLCHDLPLLSSRARASRGKLGVSSRLVFVIKLLPAPARAYQRCPPKRGKIRRVVS